MKNTPGFGCAAANEDCEAALREIVEAPPDVLLLDIQLPGLSGIAGVRRRKKTLPGLDMIMLTIHDDDRRVFDSLRAGACGYLDRSRCQSASRKACMSSMLERSQQKIHYPAMTDFDNYNPLVGHCCFCQSHDLRPYAEASYWLEFPLHFVECAGCRLIFANPMPSLRTINAGNRALNIHHTSRGTLSQYRGGKEFAWRLNKISPEGILLDVGCAEGFFLFGVKENSNWQAEGIEIIDSAVEFARQRLGLTVYHGTLDTLHDATGRFDFIRMNNVIEHVQNPVHFLEKAHQLLKPFGKVYCSTPNGFQDGHFLKTANERGLRFNLLENHFFYYHPQTLRKIFEACGFKIIRHHSEDISHSLNDFGISPRFKYPRANQNLKLNAFNNKSNEDFHISDDEIHTFKNHPNLKTWKLRLQRFRKEVFKLKFPFFLPFGHQQLVFAEKA